MDKLKATSKEISNFIKENVVKKSYYLPVLFFSIIGYGFSMFNRTISVDDLARDIYYGDGLAKIAGTRWGQYFLIKLLSTVKITPFYEQFLGLVLLIFASIIICALLNAIKPNNNTIIYSLVSSIFITYPLINEIWPYNESCVPIGLFMSVISFVILYLFLNRDNCLKEYLLLGLILSAPMAGSEDSCFCYITITMSIIYIKSSDNEYFRIIDWIKDGLRYAIPLAFALIFRYVIGFVLIELYGVSYAINGAVEIYWFDSFWGCLSNIIKYNLMYYFLSAFSYLPITIYDLSIIAFVILVIKNRRSKNDIFISILLLLSPFFLSIIQGNKLPYRCCAPIQYFVTFVAYLLLIDVYESNKKIFNVKLKTIVIALVVFMTLRQSICLHELLALNNQRSENEAFVARQIGYRIYSEFDKDKTVVVCGEYQLGEFINNQIYINSNEFPGKIESMVRDFLLDKKDNDYSRKYIQTNINSHLNWSTNAFHSQEMIKIYLSYYGYDVNTLPYMSDEDEKEYVKIAENESMKPFEIKDMGDYILVYLGPIIDD